MKKTSLPLSQKNYSRLFELSRHSKILNGVLSILHWDQETYMPHGSAGIRSVQSETMAGLIHREKTDKKFKNALSKLIDLPTGKIIADDLSPEKQAALREWRKDFIRDTALPIKFVREFAKTTSSAMQAWQSAKKDNAFMQFAPFLDRIVELNRKKADFLGYKDHPYDALLNEFEPGASTADIDVLFTKLKKPVTKLVKESADRPVDDSFLHGIWDREKQIEFGKKILNAMGYDMNKGRIDFSSHPFSSASHPSDSRITTRIHPTSLISNIFVLLHEGGHALYEMGLPEPEYGSPLGEACSLGIHESQSRWWETRIGMSKPFWKHFYPVLKETFKPALDHIPLDLFYAGINKVQPSFIRVEADELTYPLHVILRFELEKDLIEGTLKIRDIPEAWNARMNEYLGITPRTASEGCLQDIHWSMGAFGYFPTYTLGNLYAAHLYEAFAKSRPDRDEKIAEGSFGFINEWLKENVYKHGRRYSSTELVEKATGRPFSADAYLHYLETKYGSGKTR